MRKFYFTILVLCFFYKLSAQSVMLPTDSVITYNAGNPPAQPSFGTIGKWVRTQRLSWNTNEYKCYIYKGCEYRLHFPKSYNPAANDGKKYPILIFFHGLGEGGNIYDNEYQLYHGGDVFQAAVDNGTFDGYVLCMQSQGFWGMGQYQYISEILDYMTVNNKLDPFSIFVNGLSAGGQGTWEMMFNHPNYVTCDIPMSQVDISYQSPDTINKVKFTPVWNIQGGQDGAPAPSTAEQVRAAMLAGGANYTYTEFATQGHDTWDSTWLLPNFWSYMLSNYSSNPWALSGHTNYCPADPIKATIGLAPGYAAYQWRLNGTIIPEAATNSIVATQAGTYDARVERGTIWSDWSHTPVVITVLAATATPPIQTTGIISAVIPAADGKNFVNLQVSGNGTYTGYVWKKVGSDSVYSKQSTFTATQPGYYVVAASQPYSCSSNFSTAFKVISANGLNAPSVVKSLSANTLSNTQIQIGWSKPVQQVNPPTVYEIYRGTSSGSYSYITQINPAQTVYNDSLLTPKVKYFYVVRAVDSTGAAALSNEASAATFSDTIAPSIPVNLKSTYTTPSTISIAWTASSDNVAVDHYSIYVNGILSNVTKKTSFILTGLATGQSYSIYVKAVDGSNNYSSASSQIIAEPVLGGLQYSLYTTAAAWSVLPNFATLTPVKTGIAANTDITVATQNTNYGFLWQGYIQVPVSGTYIFQTTSDDGSAMWFNSFTPIGTPTVNNNGLHGSQSATSSSLTVTAGIYPVCIEYFQAGGGYNMSVSWASNALFGNTTQHAITNNYFQGTYAAAGTVPALPSGVTATASSYNKINVAWKDNSNNETGFEIYRAIGATGIFNIVGTAAANTTAFGDSSSLSVATTYYYKVQAINNYGSSGLSRQDSAFSTNGLKYSYYTGSWSALPNFTTFTPVKTGVSSTTDLSVATQTINYGFVWQGAIKITTPGSYTFGTSSDDGSAMWFNSYTPTGTPTVNNDGLHAATTKSSSAVTLAAGIYPVCIEFFQSGGSASMYVSYQGPNIATQLIPNSAFYQLTVAPVPSATTFAAPSAPAAPANFTAVTGSSSGILLSWTNVANNSGYQISRSIGDTLSFRILTTLSANKISYNDTGLNANLAHYYKIKTIGAGNNLSSASAASATTKDNAPVIIKMNATAVPYGISTAINVNASDADGDVLSFTTHNLPAFASISSNGSNGIILTLNPAQTNLGVYNNVTIIAADPYGGKDSTSFTLTVNSNYAPTIDSIANFTMNENDVLNISLYAHDQNAGDVLSFSVANAPNAFSISSTSNGQATLIFHPNYLSAGVYNPIITVSDGNGGTTIKQFQLTVNDVNPNVNIYTRFQYTDSVGKPWNSITSSTTNNLVDASGAVTNIGLAVQGSWFTTYNTGTPTGNNSGVYPDAVLEDYLYFGIYGGPATLDTKLTGLDTSRFYNLTFFASSVFPGAANNGATIYTAGNVSDTLEVQANTKNTVTISSVKPAGDGTITYTMSKNVDATVGYINALVISSLYDDGNAPAAATNLAAQNVTGKGVQLTWKDVAYNEAGYNVYRALTAKNVYAQIGQTAADATSFMDTSFTGNTQYSYRITAYNAHCTSDSSNIATITTIDRIPQIVAISDVALKNNQTATLNIVAKDDSTDHITLSVSGLPSFATFTNNGNGTGKIIVTPTANILGAFPVIVTATDLANASSSDTFNILVSDPNISSTYLSFSDGYHAIPKPWNMLAGYPFAGTTFSNINDDSNTPTGMVVTFKNGFQGVAETGMQPVSGYGIYPNVIMRTAEFEGSTNKDTIQITGLSTSKVYNFVFFNSHDDGLVGNTNFNIGATTVTLNATDNISKTVQINGIFTTTGTVNIVVSKVAGADFAFLSTLIIQSYASTYTALAPSNLRTTTITRNSIGLQWEDRAYNETGYQVWRAADSAGSYTLLATVAAGVTSYTDSNLATNKMYNYAVRTVLSAGTYSGFSNTVSASTYAYNVYVNYTASNNATLPWNNTDAIPQAGYTWNNFFDDKGMPSSTGMLLTSTWAGLYNAGMNPLNNSGVLPDTVMIDSYGLFPGQNGTLQMTGLNIGMKYDLTFYASSQAYGDVNVAFIVNGITTLLNASLNINGTETVYGITPDSYGNISISVAAGTSTSQFGLLGALIIKGYTPSVSTVVPMLPASAQSSTQRLAAKRSDASDKAEKPVAATVSEIKAFPNPFHDQFTLLVPSQNNKGSVQVMLYDAAGKQVYSNNFSNVHEGTSTLNVVTGVRLAAGIYSIVILNADTNTSKTIKIIKE